MADKKSNASLSSLIEALQIVLKYGDMNYPTHCEHDELFIKCSKQPTPEDVARLEELGFNPSKEGGGFSSFRFGSC